MPVIQVKLSQGRTLEQKQTFAAAVTKEAERLLGVKREWVTVLFDEYSRESWATAGEMHAYRFGEEKGREDTK